MFTGLKKPFTELPHAIFAKNTRVVLCAVGLALPLAACQPQIVADPALLEAATPQPATSPPRAPSALALVTPSATPANIPTPTIRVSGLTAGDTILIYADSSCTLPALKASGQALGTTLDLTSIALPDGTVSFYAQAIDPAGNASPCSSATVSYTLDTVVPTVTGLSDDPIPHQSKSWTWGCSKASCTYQYLIDQNAGSSPNGAYEATVSASQFLGTATHYLHVRAQDSVGNISSVMTVSAVIDNTASAAPSALALLTPATSPSNNTAPTIQISGVVSGDAVELHSNSSCTSLKASGVAAGATIDLTSSALTDAAYSFYAKSIDPAGNASGCSSATVAYTLDTAAVAVTGLSNDPTAHQTKAWTWGCSKASCTYRYLIDQNAGTSPSGVYGATASASQLSGTGTYYLHVQAQDSAGNVSAVATVSAILDNTASSAPSGLALVTPATSPSNNTTPTIRISGVVSGDTIELHSNSSCTSLKASGVAAGATLDLTSSALSSGALSFFAKAIDPAGNASSCSTATVSYTLDTTAPTVTGLSNDPTPHQSKGWTWGCSEACTYRYLIDQNAGTSPSGVYGATTSASQSSGTATYYIHVQAQDSAGNVSAVTTVSAILDNTPPGPPTALALFTPAASPSNNTTPTIRISGVVSGDTVELHSNSSCTSLKASGVAAGATIDLTSSALTDATYSFYAKATDPAGNPSSCSSATVSYTLDTVLPTVTGLSNDPTPHQAKAWAWGCSKASCNYRYLIDQSAGTSPSGSYSATASASQASGTATYYIHVQAQDSAGNVSSVTTVSAILDNTASSAPSGLALVTPATSPSTNTTPTIRVSGVVSGDTVELHSNSGCTALQASGVAAGTTIDLTSSALSVGAHSFYAKAIDPVGNASSCSTATLAYTVSSGITPLPNNAVNNSWVDMTGNVLLLHFDEPAAGGDRTFTDSSGLGITATCVAASCPQTVADNMGNYLHFSGAQQLNLGTQISQAFTSITIASWVRGGGNHIIERGVWNNEDGFGLVYSGANPTFGHWFGGSGYPMYNLPAVAPAVDAAWHHIVGTMTPIGGGQTEWKIYTDAVLTADIIDIRVITASGSATCIGNRCGDIRYFNGDLEELAIWNRALSPAEILTIFQAQQGL